MRLCFLLLLLLLHAPLPAETVSLAGDWRFQLDPMDVGRREQWFNSTLPDTVRLPGTTDLNERGFELNRETGQHEISRTGRKTEVQVLRTQWPGTVPPARANESGHLVRPWYYVGKAWYQREIDIPADWAGKRVELRLERVLWQSEVWLDSRPIGSHDSLVAVHRYDLGPLEPGKHRLTICVDNGLVHNIGILGHAYGPETQSRWNGIVGQIELVVTPAVAIRNLEIHPAVDRASVAVKMDVVNTTGAAQDAEITLTVRDEDDRPYGGRLASVRIGPAGREVTETIPITGQVKAWDEFHPVRYQVTATLRTTAGEHQTSGAFGFRNIARDGRSIRVNGRRIFLRGTLDCALYPLTGHPPMTVAEWLGVLETVKDYGFNHVRFHTWCPPEAAFEAADRLGIYLAPETPFWVDNWTVQTASYPKLIGSDEEVTRYVQNEIRRISEAYGNHPSFAFFSIGNEFGLDSDWDLIDRLLAEAKRRDPRRLYNATSARRRVPSDDYWVTHAVDRARVRGEGPPRTDWDFSDALRGTDVPVISHETGQRPVFPDFPALLAKFTGPLKPDNFVRLEPLLSEHGQAAHAADFTRASSRFQYTLYKAEHEAILRSAESAGYQLLMLTDFTGQSEALVGILDAFRDEKGHVTREEVRRWNAPTVLLARFPKYVWSADERLSASVEVAHFGADDLDGFNPRWSIRSSSGDPLRSGNLESLTVPAGGHTRLGEIDLPLDGLPAPAALTLEVSAGEVRNQWPLWVYPPQDTEPGDTAGLVIAEAFDTPTREALRDGKAVLLLAHGLKNSYTARTSFAPVYWSAGWWGTPFAALGILCDPEHPALAGFPNAGHSDWQWYDLTNRATSFLLEDAPPGFKPIVQPVPDFHYNRLLAHAFEARAGGGRLLVSGYDLSTDLASRPAASQFRRSLIQYMKSPEFRPRHELDMEYLDRLLTPTAE